MLERTLIPANDCKKFFNYLSHHVLFLTNFTIVGFEVLTAVAMKRSSGI
jgi:hypothetical protein